ncbi:hypothetical protein DSO57_1023678 [Entomophthora muscae]|uniref:Uncharacterized protein n=1 Tax=Entomophthora muscae TaxID=34485 RepID=A0ACC2SFV1_9FUNG|nr:hypothetical protein DSO57_1023678 [Entomophthora muscae]
MDYQPKQSKACDACRTRKIKCLPTRDNNCQSCHRRGIICTFNKDQLPPIQTLLARPADPRFDSLSRLLNFRVTTWKLEPTVPHLVLSYLHHAGPNNSVFPISMIVELLQEPHLPEMLPLVLSAMDHHLHPSNATTSNAHRAMRCLRKRDSRLLLASLSILRQASATATLRQPAIDDFSPLSSEKSVIEPFPDYKL